MWHTPTALVWQYPPGLQQVDDSAMLLYCIYQHADADSWVDVLPVLNQMLYQGRLRWLGHVQSD